MSLISDLEDIRSQCEALSTKARAQQEIYFKVISGVVKLHQENRIAKNFAVSDAIRSMLNDAGIEIIQGTAAYKYEEIPPQLNGRQVEDTWRIKE